MPAALPLLVSATLIAAALSACGGGSSNPPAPEPAPQPAQTITLAASGSPMLQSAPLTLTATVSKAADISWQLASGSPGSLSSGSGASVVYTPPAAGSAAITPVLITVSSAGVSKTLRLSLYPNPGLRTGITLLAGSLAGRGWTDGQAATARYNRIQAIASGPEDTLVVADAGDTPAGAGPARVAIRRVGSSGYVDTLARLPFGHADGDAAHAQNGNILSLAAAANGDIYMLDSDGALRLRVRKADGSVTTLQDAGSAPADARQLLQDRQGLRYLIAGGASGQRILRVAADGKSNTLLAGQLNSGAVVTDGQGAAASFRDIADACADTAGNLYVLDSGALRKITPAGLVTTLAGKAMESGPSVDGSGPAARFSKAASLSIDSADNLLVLDQQASGDSSVPDYRAYTVRKVTPAGLVSTVYRGAAPPYTGAQAADNIATPVAALRVHLQSGAILLARSAQIDSLAGASLQSFSGLEGDSSSEVDGPADSARFVRLSKLGADLNGNVYTIDFAAPYGAVGDEEAHGLWLRKIAANGTVTSLVADPAFARQPTALATDADGFIYVSARTPQRSGSAASGGAIYKVTPEGKVSLFAGAPGNSSGQSDGSGTAAHFTAPVLEGIDVNGDLYVSDGQAIRKITPQAVVSTVAALPAKLRAAPDGNVYSADPLQHVIYRSDSNGGKTVVLGIPGVRGAPRLGIMLGEPTTLEAPRDVVATGPGSFAVISGAAVLRFVLVN
ncbi:hypothetical protein HSX11_23985 [Oxalobacteraceae bacterium]|nr:hypothetical protein [Oxalobacteraceae bacterium]